MSPSRSAGADGGGRPRRPARVYGVGTEPDARFSLANERTALAWLRTGLALVAGGAALTSLATFAELSTLLDVVAAVACLLGGIVGVSALVGWQATERALRQGQPLPPPRLLPVLAVSVVALALVLGGYAIAQAV